MVWRKYPYEITNTGYIYYNLAHLTRVRTSQLCRRCFNVGLLNIRKRVCIQYHCPLPPPRTTVLPTGKNKCIFKTNNIIWTIYFTKSEGRWSKGTPQLSNQSLT